MALNPAQIIQVADIPPIPHLVEQIMTLADNPATTSGKLEALVNQEPALVTRILKWVNSALYSFPNRINSVRHAMIILGFATVKSIASGLALMNAFEGIPGLDRDQILAIWRHGLTSAHYAKLLASREKGDVQDTLYLACMIQNAGCIVLKQYFGTPYGEFLKTHWPPNTADEQAAFETDHTLIGQELLREWRFSEEVASLVGSHHGELTGGPESKMMAYMRAANILTESEWESSGLSSNLFKEYGVLGLSDAFLGSIKDELSLIPRAVSLIMDQS